MRAGGREGGREREREQGGGGEEEVRRGEEASGLEAAISGIVNHQDAANRAELQNFTRVHLCGGGGGVT